MTVVLSLKRLYIFFRYTTRVVSAQTLGDLEQKSQAHHSIFCADWLVFFLVLALLPCADKTRQDKTRPETARGTDQTGKHEKYNKY